jgi:hypothetical protein
MLTLYLSALEIMLPTAQCKGKAVPVLKLQTTKMRGGSGGLTKRDFNLDTRWSGQVDGLITLPPKKEPPTPIE